MDRVKARIQPESKVRIVGYADKTGNPEYNRTLARKRCLEVQKVLGLPDDRVTLEPVGSDRQIFENETPEGRSYSRTVQIELVTPIR
jgi:outer membrane protein OmpA-like peptidoglycan-associated protein